MLDSSMEETNTIIEEQETQTEQNTSQQEESNVQSIDVESIKQQAAKEVGALYLGALSEKDRQIQEIKAQMEQMRSAPPPSQIEEIDGAKFLESPNKHIRSVIREEMQSQLQPMQQLWNQFSAQQQITQIKTQLAQVPTFKEILETYGDVVDQLVGNAVSMQNYQSAILMIPGLIQTGQIAARGNVSNSNSNKSSVSPPNIPPSSPPAPRKDKPVELSLTESERLIAKRLGMSEADYVKYRDADSTVDSWKEKGK